MITWSTFEEARPEMAAAGRDLFYRADVGKALLATVRDGEPPRVHPVYVAILDGHLYAFVHRSAMRADLATDGRYALHAHQDPAAPSEFTIRGRARAVESPAEVEAAARAWYFEVDDATTLFEFSIESALLGERRDADEWPPRYSTWKADDADR